MRCNPLTQSCVEEPVISAESVIPAKAGISIDTLDPRLRGDDTPFLIMDFASFREQYIKYKMIEALLTKAKDGLLSEPPRSLRGLKVRPELNRVRSELSEEFGQEYDSIVEKHGQNFAKAYFGSKEPFIFGKMYNRFTERFDEYKELAPILEVEAEKGVKEAYDAYVRDEGPKIESALSYVHKNIRLGFKGDSAEIVEAVAYVKLYNEGVALASAINSAKIGWAENYVQAREVAKYLKEMRINKDSSLSEIKEARRELGGRIKTIREMMAFEDASNWMGMLYLNVFLISVSAGLSGAAVRSLGLSGVRGFAVDASLFSAGNQAGSAALLGDIPKNAGDAALRYIRDVITLGAVRLAPFVGRFTGYDPKIGAELSKDGAKGFDGALTARELRGLASSFGAVHTVAGGLADDALKFGASYGLLHGSSIVFGMAGLAPMPTGFFDLHSLLTLAILHMRGKLQVESRGTESKFFKPGTDTNPFSVGNDGSMELNAGGTNGSKTDTELPKPDPKTTKTKVSDPHEYTLGASDAEMKRLTLQADLYGGVELLLSNVKEGDTVLDIGSGTGVHAIAAAKKVGINGHVHGIDMEEAKVEFAERLAEEQNMRNVDFKKGDAYELPFADGSVDVVYFRFVLRHVSDPMRALQEAIRVLKPGGKIAVVEAQNRSIQFSPSIPTYEKVWKAWIEDVERRGGDQSFGDCLGSVLAEAGFVGIQTNRFETDVSRDDPAFSKYVGNSARYFGRNGAIKALDGFTPEELDKASNEAWSLLDVIGARYYKYVVVSVGMKPTTHDGAIPEPGPKSAADYASAGVVGQLAEELADFVPKKGFILYDDGVDIKQDPYAYYHGMKVGKYLELVRRRLKKLGELPDGWQHQLRLSLYDSLDPEDPDVEGQADAVMLAMRLWASGVKLESTDLQEILALRLRLMLEDIEGGVRREYGVKVGRYGYRLAVGTAYYVHTGWSFGERFALHNHYTSRFPGKDDLDGDEVSGVVDFLSPFGNFSIVRYRRLEGTNDVVVARESIWGEKEDLEDPRVKAYNAMIDRVRKGEIRPKDIVIPFYGPPPMSSAPKVREGVMVNFVTKADYEDVVFIPFELMRAAIAGVGGGKISLTSEIFNKKINITHFQLGGCHRFYFGVEGPHGLINYEIEWQEEWSGSLF